MKKIILKIINIFGLILMLLSSYSFSKQVGVLSISDPVYVAGFVIGALIPMVIGYFLFRFKVKDKEDINNSSDNEHDSEVEKIPVVEYIKQFDTFKSQWDLVEAGLWLHRVHVKHIPEHFIAIIEKKDFYHIGFEYPVTASIFDMSMELPVMFTKLDGSTLSLGISLEDLELIEIKN